MEKLRTFLFTIPEEKILIIEMPRYKRVFPAYCNEFHRVVKESIESKRLNLHTNQRFQKRWVYNSLKNHDYVQETSNILKFDFSPFRDKPLMIVSAGPSLALEMNNLKYIKENKLAYIFCVGSAINALIENDIVPHAMFTYDPGVHNATRSEEHTSELQSQD